MGVSQSEMEDVLKDFPKTFTISGTRDLMKRHNFRKEYVEVFEKFVAGLVEHKNSPEWKEKFAGLLESIKVPGPDNIKRFKQIAPDALPADKKIRKQLLLDSGFDKDVVERLDPYLEQLEEMEFWIFDGTFNC